MGRGPEEAIGDAGVQVGQNIAVTNAGKQVGDYTRKGQTIRLRRIQWEVRAVDPGQALERSAPGERSSRIAQQIGGYIDEYRAVSEMADRFGYSALAQAMAEAAESLERLEPLSRKGSDPVSKMPKSETIKPVSANDLQPCRNRWRSLTTVSGSSARTASGTRPAVQRRSLRMPGMRPLGEETHTLSEPAADSIYSPRTASELAQSLIKDRPAESLAEALKETGLDAKEIAARIDLRRRTRPRSAVGGSRHACGCSSPWLRMSTEAGLERTQEKTDEIYDRIEHGHWLASRVQSNRRSARPLTRSTKALEDAKQLAAKGSLSDDDARRLRENVEKALGVEVVKAMQRGEHVQIAGLDEVKSRDFAVAYLRADEQWGRDHGAAISRYNAAAVQIEYDERRQREARGQEQRGHDFE